ncbi:ATP-binding protein [Reichenbachiella ulvae]|uniref:DUF87 domain-containing protein n=1 Tax=Reichenbachiella ulvae TaxID=2980104 RepID=A0ABT3CR83_9BACT|nr:DUF87 domain-containing protein [Reichenbachiella ulvae]MCV9385995.1 DUF87 domain-containing protein [Reichenbachiella ulvae]
MTVNEEIKRIASVDPLKEGRKSELFVGHPFQLDYNKASVLVCDDDKQKVNGIAQGTFLLAFYDNEDEVEEAILLRALNPARLPTDSAVVGSMIEYYKDNLPTSGKNSKLDDFTRYEFSFSGLECRVLGTFYRSGEKAIEFGADLENFYSAHHYSVYKVNNDVLGYIVNQRDSPDIVPGNENEFPLGSVRYSSSLRFQNKSEQAKVYLNPADLIGKRSALFGMTRTGKSNTVKKVIQATTEISSKARSSLGDKSIKTEENLESFTEKGSPKYMVGQIIFDVNGEYANANLQDEGTAIFEMYASDVTRYSVLDKPGFTVMKVNFYKQIQAGFELIKSYLADDSADFVKSLLAVNLEKPSDDLDESAKCRWERKIAAYLCCLKKANFPLPSDMKTLKFSGNADLNNLVKPDGSLDPKRGISFDQAINWFETIWDNYGNDFFKNYRAKRDKEWADEDLQAILVFLTRKRKPGKSVDNNGYLRLRGIIEQHTPTGDEAFTSDIVKLLRQGKIVIVDISQGNPGIQKMYSEMLCKSIFNDSMNRFIANSPNNFIQFYFEEAHNLFPQKEDKDLNKIYNRIAKEGAKLNLGMMYATQEVSSISSNILKNTQNWFIAHLNNEDEIRELRKYYDFSDFTDSLIRFSAKNDKGFVRMKTYSNPFVVPVQIDKFSTSQ